jgi:hypothetical protein
MRGCDKNHGEYGCWDVLDDTGSGTPNVWGDSDAYAVELRAISRID